jgi:hypothetical protein
LNFEMEKGEVKKVDRVGFLQRLFPDHVHQASKRLNLARLFLFVVGDLSNLVVTLALVLGGRIVMDGVTTLTGVIYSACYNAALASVDVSLRYVQDLEEEKEKKLRRLLHSLILRKVVLNLFFSAVIILHTLWYLQVIISLLISPFVLIRYTKFAFRLMWVKGDGPELGRAIAILLVLHVCIFFTFAILAGDDWITENLNSSRRTLFGLIRLLAVSSLLPYASVGPFLKEGAYGENKSHEGAVKIVYGTSLFFFSVMWYDVLGYPMVEVDSVIWVIIIIPIVIVYKLVNRWLIAKEEAACRERHGEKGFDVDFLLKGYPRSLFI